MRYSEPDGVVTGFELDDGSLYRGRPLRVSHAGPQPLEGFASLSSRPAPFDGLRHLHGVPVMTVQLYFDRPVTGVNNLIFSSRSHISVYAELGAICSDFREELGGRSMVELVVAPAAEWFKLDDEH